MSKSEKDPDETGGRAMFRALADGNAKLSNVTLRKVILDRNGHMFDKKTGTCICGKKYWAAVADAIKCPAN
jgi:hypothetical protein